MPKGMQPIFTQNITSTVATVSFVNIPQTYTDLKVIASGRSTNSNNVYFDAAYYLTFNNDSSSIYSSTRLYGLGSGAGLGSDRRTNVADATFGLLTATETTANVFGVTTVDIPNYTSNFYKSFTSDSMNENNANACVQQFTASTYRSFAPITRMTLNGNWVANSTITLYGISR